MRKYFVNGHCVICARFDHHPRIWTCDFSEFERRLHRYGEGFCEHVVAAIESAIREERSRYRLIDHTLTAKNASVGTAN